MNREENIDCEPVDTAILSAKLAEYEILYPGAFKILEAGGVHPTRENPILNPYLPGSPQDTEDCGNIGRHCVAVAYCAEKLCAGDPALQNATVARALIHDANKRYEVMRRNAARQQPADLAAAYSRKAYEQIVDRLRGQVDPDLLRYLVAAGKETGHTSLVDFLVVNPTRKVILNPRRTVVEKIVHLADDMTASQIPQPGENADWEPTRYVSCRDRMALGDFPRRYPNLYTGGIGFDDRGNPQEVLQISQEREKVAFLRHFQTFAEWQARCARMICEELQLIRDPDNRQDPELFVCELVNM